MVQISQREIRKIEKIREKYKEFQMFRRMFKKHDKIVIDIEEMKENLERSFPFKEKGENCGFS